MQEISAYFYVDRNHSLERKMYNDIMIQERADNYEEILSMEDTV